MVRITGKSSSAGALVRLRSTFRISQTAVLEISKKGGVAIEQNLRVTELVANPRKILDLHPSHVWSNRIQIVYDKERRALNMPEVHQHFTLLFANGFATEVDLAFDNFEEILPKGQ